MNQFRFRLSRTLWCAVLAGACAFTSTGCKTHHSQPPEVSPDATVRDSGLPDGGKTNPDGQVACTDLYAYGLSIEVKVQSPWECSELIVTAQDGSYSEGLPAFPGSAGCTFSGAGERAGSYDITIKGYGHSITLPSVVVKAGTCHVVGAHRVVQFIAACTTLGDDAGAADGGTSPTDCVSTS
jgi:hypothetical protein